MTEEAKEIGCPLMQQTCEKKDCAWWIEYEGREFGECAVRSIAVYLRELHLRGIDVTNHF